MFEFLVGPPFGMALVMEYIEGELLSDVVKRARFSVEDAVTLGTGILSGVAEMHSAGIIHRDIKPENVILRPNSTGWHAVVFDFNLSRVTRPLGTTSSLTSLNAAIGTVPYMAPEQLLDARRAMESSVVYSVGTILYRAVSTVLPFDLRASLREKLLREAKPLDAGRVDAIGKGFERIVGKAIRRRPAERYAKAQLMLDELEALTVAAP